MADDDDLSPWERDLARHEAEIVGDPIFEQTVIDKPLRQSVRSPDAEADRSAIKLTNRSRRLTASMRP